VSGRNDLERKPGAAWAVRALGSLSANEYR
jgi:hypothetical protein